MKKLNEKNISRYMELAGMPKIEISYALIDGYAAYVDKDYLKENNVHSIIFADSRLLKEDTEAEKVQFEKTQADVVREDSITYIYLPITEGDLVWLSSRDIVGNRISEKDVIRLFLDEDTYKEINYKIEKEKILEEVTKTIRLNEEHLIKQIEEEEYNKTLYVGNAIKCVDRINTLKRQLRGDSVVDELVNHIEKEFSLIEKHKMVDKLSFEEGYIVVETKPIIMTEPVTNRRYYLGKMMIQFNIRNGNHKIENLDNERHNFWGDGGKHPHVDLSGEACLGTAESQIAQFIIDKEYYGTFITFLNFLQTADINDPAGYHICEWDEVDENGKVIKEGHKPTQDEYDGKGCISEGVGVTECSICGYEMDEDDVYYCETCGRPICGDCIRTEWNDNYVCTDCIEGYDMIECNKCGNWVLGDDAVEIDGQYYCPSCAEEV